MSKRATRGGRGVSSQKNSADLHRNAPLLIVHVRLSCYKEARRAMQKDIKKFAIIRWCGLYGYLVDRFITEQGPNLCCARKTRCYVAAAALLNACRPVLFFAARCIIMEKNEREVEKRAAAAFRSH